METIANHILGNIDEVIGRWIALQIDEPWVRLPVPDVVDHLPAVITTIVRAALTDAGNLDSHRAKVSAAAEHGRQRRRAGFGQEVVFHEYYGVRQALSGVVSPLYEQPTAGRAMLRIDSAMTSALRASLLGYHEAELGSANLQARLEAIALASPLLNWS